MVFVIGGRLLFCRRISKNVCVFIFYAVVMVAFDMITYPVLAQSFLTSILRVGVWIISRLFSLMALLERRSALTGSGAILDSVSSDVIGQSGVPFLSSVSRST